jgi:hypothetical protein
VQDDPRTGLRSTEPHTSKNVNVDTALERVCATPSQDVAQTHAALRREDEGLSDRKPVPQRLTVTPERRRAPLLKTGLSDVYALQPRLKVTQIRQSIYQCRYRHWRK